MKQDIIEYKSDPLRYVLPIIITTVILAIVAVLAVVFISGKGYITAEIFVVDSLDSLARLFDAGWQRESFWFDDVWYGWGSYYYGCSYFVEDMIVYAMEDDVADGGTPEFSGTNNQVGGVDESDVVKTDGFYLYSLSMEKIVGIYGVDCKPVMKITKIWPLDLSGSDVVGVQSEVRFEEEFHPRDIALHDDLVVVFGDSYGDYSNVHMKVFDVSDRKNPELVREVKIEGYYTTSRMVNGYIYLSTTFYPDVYSNKPHYIPVLSDSNKENLGDLVDVNSIRYVNTVDPRTLVTLTALDLNDLSKDVVSTSLAARSSIVYASTNAFYFITSQYEQNSQITSIILRISYNELDLEYTGFIEIPGIMINQFSIDEHEGFLRIASNVQPWSDKISSMITIIDIPTMKVTGTITDIAPEETIKSVRFSEDLCYLVTFLQVDPFFVITLDPQNPEVVGHVKIPGFSSYLHILSDENVLGVGEIESQVKVSLFDVSDLENPIEEAQYIVPSIKETIDSNNEYQYMSTLVSNDHKAFLYDTTRNLIALPVYKTYYKFNNYDTSILHQDISIILEVQDSTTGKSLNKRGEITHLDLFDLSFHAANYYDEDPSLRIGRQIFVENTLFTISNDIIRAHSLITLEPIYSLWYTNPNTTTLLIH